jgi:hypothetical protein
MLTLTNASPRSQTQIFLGDLAEKSASFNLCAQSSQHTSTVLPPIVTLIEYPSSLQSHAAHVFSAIPVLL